MKPNKCPLPNKKTFSVSITANYMISNQPYAPTDEWRLYRWSSICKRRANAYPIPQSHIHSSFSTSICIRFSTPQPRMGEIMCLSVCLRCCLVLNRILCITLLNVLDKMLLFSISICVKLKNMFNSFHPTIMNNCV